MEPENGKPTYVELCEMLHAREVGKPKPSRIDTRRFPDDTQCDTEDELVIQLCIVWRHNDS
jgi:hypothetical protein